ncbi:MAG: septum site-determining protein Ssd [Mycobacterium sp.]
MTSTAGLLALIAESALADEVDRVAAAAGVRAIHLDPAAVPTRKTWLAAAAIVLDSGAAGCCAAAGLPRRHAVFVCGLGEPTAATLQVAISLGAQDVLTMPEQADELVRGVGAVGDPARSSADGGVVAVIAGRGGAGASLFAAALSHHLGSAAGGALLVDLDPWGGGIDLLLGGERLPGLRWPDLAVQGGRLSWSAVRDALPHHRGIVVLSGTRTGHELSAGAVDTVLDASRRGGVTAVCDVPRRLTDAACIAVEAADLVVLVTQCDVRACAATTAMLPALAAVNPNIGLVVRGPAPGGLRPGDIANLAKLPLLAAMRPEPMIAEKLERTGLRLRPRSPLAVAARRVAAVLAANPSAVPVPIRQRVA